MAVVDETYESPPPTKKARIDEPEKYDTGRVWTCNTTTVDRYVKPGLGLNVDLYPGFIPRPDADAIFHQLETELKPYLEAASNKVKIMGKMCTIPRKQAAFGDAGLTYSFSGVTVSANRWIPLLSRIKNTIEVALGETFNFVLVNRYKDGTDHIGEHRDDEKDLFPGAPIVGLSLGQERDFVFKHKDSRGKSATRKDIQPVKLSLRHGSLLVMKHPTNSVWYHSVPVRKTLICSRLSLTFRRMKKTASEM